MDSLSLWQLLAVFAIFTWSGFVRNALGFGGAALSLPLFLFIIDEPVEILPIIGIHLMIAVLITLRRSYQYIDWHYL
ncbi:MAG: permease, partial [Gammaproteobacteria bacterium]